MTSAAESVPARPWALLAELTHACPLHCGCCSNPLELTPRSRELTTGQWADVMRQAGELGVVHTHLPGGEPLLRRDLPQIVTAAETAGIYTQLDAGSTPGRSPATAAPTGCPNPAAAASTTTRTSPAAAARHTP